MEYIHSSGSCFYGSERKLQNKKSEITAGIPVPAEIKGYFCDQEIKFKYNVEHPF